MLTILANIKTFMPGIKKKIIELEPGQKQEVTETEIICPECKKTAIYTETVYEVKNFGSALFSTLFCEHCGFKAHDIRSLAEKNSPIKQSARVNSIDDLETKIIRASTGTLKIPELGIEVTPTNYTEGYYNNIEGFLELIEQAATTGKGKQTQELIERIHLARNGKFKFTVHLEDPQGNSTLIGPKVKKEK